MSTCCGSCGGQDAEEIKQQEQADAAKRKAENEKKDQE
ncbi:hypothetical protein SAMN05216175_1226 [Neptunomonas qingdaonensis]|uniref:Uncharacterized protein n=1 Tax=Neptunomonas qingdaonensis TaxID=1045558 RepID=A0A1I2W3E7_9GAMM|nr:hypothetical protein SAMN05216175_1226 [Neptunomonas qingdaonensis]